MRRSFRLLLACAAGLVPAVGAVHASPEIPPPITRSTPDRGDDWLPEIQRSLAAREYEATPNQRGLQAPNRRHGLRSYFEPTGVRVHDRTAAGSPELLALRLSGLGRGARLAPVAAGELSSEGARVEIRRPGLVEWYLNSEAGLEQGFTLAERPAGEGPLVLELALVKAHARLAGDRILLDTGAGRQLAYGKLAASDVHAAPIEARFELPATNRLRIVLDDARATYPLTIDPLLTETADTQLESDQAFAQFGGSLAAAGDVNGDGYADVIVGATNYDAGQTDEGAAFVFLGGPSGIASASVATASAQLESNQGSSRFGYSVDGAGDVNGDGYADVIVGAPHYDAGQFKEGAAFVFLGSSTGIVGTNPSNAHARLESDQVTAEVGTSVAGAGDVNGDGYADVIVGAPEADSGESSEGMAWLFLGSGSGIANGNPGTAAAQLESNQAGARLGYVVASGGDVNGDGYDDVLAAAPLYEAGQAEEGSVFVFLGSSTGITGGGPSAAAARLEGNQASVGFGVGMDSAGDVNGDGYGDLIVGAPHYSAGEPDEGAAFVFHGSATGIANGNPATAAAMIQSNQTGSAFGFSVAAAGDVNGDGYGDVIVGASGFDSGESDEGIALVFLGSAAGIASGGPSAANFQLEVDQPGAGFGGPVSSAGDVNGDGYSDVVVGAYKYDAGESDEGAAFVYLGGAEGIRSGNAAAQIESNQAGALLGYSVASAGDVNGDGYSDVIISALDFDAGSNDEGAAFVFHGSAAGIAGGDLTGAAAQLESNQAEAGFGHSVASAGDVNGDGYGDVIVGAFGYDAGHTDEGATFVFLGGPSGVGNGSPSNADTTLESDQAGANLGVEVAGAGDVNGDGYADVIVGAHAFDAGEAYEGAAFVFLGSATGIANGNTTTAATRIESNQADANLGSAVSGAGDVNGDGYADVIVGAPSYDSGQTNEGAAFVFVGSASGIANGSPSNAAARLESDQAGAGLGHAAAAGDVNGDGYGDVIVGASGYDAGQSDEGAAFVFLGGPSGVGNGSPTNADATLEADQAAAEFGLSVAAAGDVNGDGYADVIVGARGLPGGAFVFLGGAAGITTTAAAQLAQAVDGIYGVAGAGDVNGDGFADVIVGAPAFDNGTTNEGGAFVFHGGGNQTGRPVLARQLRGTGSAPVQPWGPSLGSGDFKLRATLTHPLGRGRVKLQVQACPSGVPFGHGSCTNNVNPSWTDVTATSAGVNVTQTITGLVEGNLYRWRARVLHAPYSVTQPGISAPPNPAHGPWRRLFGQVLEADLRAITDTDGDGVANAADTDDDGDGLLDIHETDTGTYVSPTNTGTDPLDSDSDDDGLIDGAEVVLGTNPNNPDHDGDADLDGADNCPFIVNADQANTDALPAGNVCQCGDVNNDGVVNATDVTRASESLVGATLGGAFVPQRCNVVGPNDGGPSVCDVGDLAVLERFAQGQTVTVQNACQAYLAP